MQTVGSSPFSRFHMPLHTFMTQCLAHTAKASTLQWRLTAHTASGMISPVVAVSRGASHGVTPRSCLACNRGQAVRAPSTQPAWQRYVAGDAEGIVKHPCQPRL